MFKTVKKEIDKYVKQDVPEDWLEELAEIYSINEDGEYSTAQYIIRAIRNEVENYLEVLEENYPD